MLEHAGRQLKTMQLESDLRATEAQLRRLATEQEEIIRRHRARTRTQAAIDQQIEQKNEEVLSSASVSMDFVEGGFDDMPMEDFAVDQDDAFEVGGEFFLGRRSSLAAINISPVQQAFFALAKRSTANRPMFTALPMPAPHAGRSKAMLMPAPYTRSDEDAKGN